MTPNHPDYPPLHAGEPDLTEADVERVAKAICECSGQSWDSAGEGYREICTDFSRAAIEAMRAKP